jgi:hypothetical protein
MHRNLFSLAFVACIACASACIAAASYVSDAIGRFIVFAAKSVGNAFSIQPSFVGGTGFSAPRLAYDGPTIDLRHEARTARVGAARGI